jgi:hypothetical protein
MSWSPDPTGAPEATVPRLSTERADGEAEESHCRLCRGATALKFRKSVLSRHCVAYFRCEHCGSLQTERPFWLAEAYRSSLANSDTFAGQRALTNVSAAYVASRLFGARNALDVGGGDGLVCRLLRDYGLNCYVSDKYAINLYAPGFVEPDFRNPDLTLAFEVFEHFPEPTEDLASIFSARPRIVLASTWLYENQGEDWSYLAPDDGQHVFFYSRGAIDLIAARFGYAAAVIPAAFTRASCSFSWCTEISSLFTRTATCEEAFPLWPQADRRTTDAPTRRYRRAGTRETVIGFLNFSGPQGRRLGKLEAQCEMVVSVAKALIHKD